LLCFHFGAFRNFKHYYLFFIKGTLRDCFPHAVSYNRFVELQSRVSFQLIFLNFRAFGRYTGTTFIDSTMTPVYHNMRRYPTRFSKECPGTKKARWDGVTDSNFILYAMTGER